MKGTRQLGLVLKLLLLPVSTDTGLSKLLMRKQDVLELRYHYKKLKGR